MGKLFRAWVEEQGGVEHLAKVFGKTERTVGHWLTGHSHPKLIDANEILRMAKGKLTLEDILNSSKVGRWPKARK